MPYIANVKAQLKRLTSDSAVYGISNVLGRFITFLLVPFYTHVLLKADYGVVIVVYSYIAFLNAAFTFGLEPAYMRFVGNADPQRRNAIFTSSIVFITCASLVLGGALLLLQPQALTLLEIDAALGAIVPLALAMVVLDAINIIPFAALRMERRARYFAVVKLVGIVINVGLNVLFLLVLRWPVTSVFVSGVLASLSTTLLLLPVFLSHLRERVRAPLLRELLVFGLPTLPGAISIMLIEIIDKPIMQKLTDYATAAEYGANYKLGIFMMLVVTMFRYAWQPFYLQLASGEDARRLFARVLTYFTLTGAIIVLVLSLFIGDIVRLPLPQGRTLIPEAYWGGLGIVPIILFSYVWAGIAQILNAGVYIEKKTMFILYATTLGAAVNIACNFALIPVWGMYGAAFATFAAYFTIAVFYAVVGRRIYPIRYETSRLARIATALAIPALLWYLVPGSSLLPPLVWKLMLILLFAATLWFSGFVLPGERAELRALRHRLLRR
ncbi:MAG: polysaccharide biosynthesis protein [Bacteroidetes bacterium]|nr:polysaccharide biosynthesis protein [Bacteroidota bacterium]